jgi:hypothetical protein
MSELTKVMVLSGALDVGMLQELNKWKLPIVVPDDDPFESPEEAIEAIEEALSSSGQVEVRATDLDVMKQYLRTQRKGKLHLVHPHEKGTFEVTFGVTAMGEYIIPWRTDSIVDLLTNGESHLLDGRRKVYIANVQELYFGDTKVFILCTPVKERSHANPG